jgi:hypothetical protein
MYLSVGITSVSTAPKGIYSCIARIMQDSMGDACRKRLEYYVVGAPLASGARGEFQPLRMECPHNLMGRAHTLEHFKEELEGLPDMCIRVQYDVTDGVIDKPHREGTAVLASVGLGGDSTAQPRLEHMKFRLAHRTFQTEQEAVIECRRVVDSVFVKDKRIGESTYLQQAVPVSVVPRQAGDLKPHDNAGLSHPHVGDQLLEASPPGG